MRYFIFTLSALALASCDQPVKKQTLNSSVTQEPHDHTHQPIELNNGQKWKVVPEMLTYIRNMEKDVNSFVSTGKMTNYISLGRSLKQNIDGLTSSCTMEGQAHDELHKWLLPYIEMVDQLVNAGNQQLAEEEYIRIKSSFKEFNIYFE
jgi:hypothetical protein